MIRLTGRYAKALLKYAEENGLELIYRQALTLVMDGKADYKHAPEEIGRFIKEIRGGEKEIADVLYAFLDIAREQMDMLEVEVISAVELTPDQLERLEKKLILMFRKQLNITNSVDPSILAGLRVIAGDTVLDDSIKRKMIDMKGKIYEGMYFKQ